MMGYAIDWRGRMKCFTVISHKQFNRHSTEMKSLAFGVRAYSSGWSPVPSVPWPHSTLDRPPPPNRVTNQERCHGQINTALFLESCKKPAPSLSRIFCRQEGIPPYLAEKVCTAPINSSEAIGGGGDLISIFTC
ncbi:UNVERIFIED_CONTAM: hypothetical protein K2H54_010257 [Gekko kuhli]